MEILSPSHSSPKIEDLGKGLCEICRVKASVYCCPACNRRSCSVECVKQHKVEYECSGVRCKTAFVPLHAFTDQHLLSDYYFLEEVGRLAESAHRSATSFAREHSGPRETRTFHWLRKCASERGTVLRLQPPGMLRHSLNTSKTAKRGNKKTRDRNQWRIYWRVHLNFPECEASYQLKSVSEEEVLGVFLEKYLHPQHSDPLLRHRLHSHVVKGGVSAVEVWLDEGKERGAPQQLLDSDLTLKENFRNKTITEFPVLTVLSKGAGPPITEPHPIKREGGVEGKVEPCPNKMEEVEVEPRPIKMEEGEVEPHPIEVEEGEVEPRPIKREKGEVECFNSLRMIANIYSDSDNDSN